jgi:hypothetical protein
MKKTKTNKKRSTRSYSGKSAAITPTTAPVTAYRNTKLRGGIYNMALSRTEAQERKGFRYIAEVDLLGMHGPEHGITPSWKATYMNAVGTSGNSAQSKFCEYAAYPDRTETMLTRLGAQRPLSDCALGAKAFYVDNAGGGKAAVFTPEDCLNEQEQFMKPVGVAVGLHVKFLHHCIDISTMYETQRTQGSIGESDVHTRPGQTTQSTPYEAYHNLLLTKFDVNQLNIPLNQRTHFTLADLAYAALDLLAPISHGHGISDTWTMSTDLYVPDEPFHTGMAIAPWGEITDADGEARYVINPPTFGKSGAQNEEIVIDLASMYTINPNSVPTFTMPAGVVFAGSTEADNIFVGETSLTDAPGSLALFNAIKTSTTSGTFQPMTGGLYAPAFGGNITGFSSRRVSHAGLLAGTNLHRTDVLWDIPTHELVTIVRHCSRVLTPAFRSMGHSIVKTFPVSGTLVCPTPWSTIIDMHNLFSTFTMNFNPRQEGPWNNGPYGLGIEARQQYWLSNTDAAEFTAVQTALETVFGNISVPSGVGLAEIQLREIFGLLPDLLYESLFTTSRSSHNKRERMVILPAGRTSTDTVISSSAPGANMEAHLALIRRYLFGSWRTATLMPLSDVRYTDTAPIHILGRGLGAAPPGWSYTPSYAVPSGAQSVAGGSFSVVRSLATRSDVGLVEVALEGTGTIQNISGSDYESQEFSGDVWIPADSMFTHHIKQQSPVFANTAVPNSLQGSLVTDAGTIHSITNGSYVPRSDGGIYDRYADYTVLTNNAATSGTTVVRGSEDLVASAHVAAGSITYEGSWAAAPDSFAAMVADLGAIPVTGAAHAVLLDPASIVDEATFLAAVSSGPNFLSRFEIARTSFTSMGAPGYNGNLYHVSWHLQLDGVLARAVTSSGAVGSRIWRRVSDGALFGGTATGTNLQAVSMGGAPFNLLHWTMMFPGAWILSAQDVTDLTDSFNGEYLLPELAAVKLRPDLYLFDAAVAKYSNLRFYPRSICNDVAFAGLPYHGTPDQFMRGLVEDLAPELVDLDFIAANPFLPRQTESLNYLRVDKETYDQLAYKSSMLAIANRYGDMYSLADVNSILGAQEALVRRGQMI